MSGDRYSTKTMNTEDQNQSMKTSSWRPTGRKTKCLSDLSEISRGRGGVEI